jgi:hypothetical protein
VHTVKKVNDFPVPSRDVTNQTLPGLENLNYSRARESLVSDIPAGDGKWQTFFYSACSLVSVYDIHGGN